ncbi:MAG: aromatic amino acid ammonia-lyase, partial [Ignavibacteria bacterium]|nr:aromatic amino acid ammonia-lyase [Ignavibacteria bacterium]
MQLTSEDIFNVLYHNKKITISDSELKQLDASNVFLSEYIKGKIVYGVNTGFGPMAQYIINDDQQKQLQLNLIRSHAAGSGDVISPIFIKATLLARLNTLRQSYSAVSSQTVTLLTDFINNDIYPVIYQHGGVGASGDLVQLSHVALSLIGEGEVIFKGEIIPTKHAMDLCKLNPLKITIREGLALINGTSTMNGIGYVNVFLSKNLVNWMIKLSSLMYEILSVYDDFFSAELNNTKKHYGQRYIAKSLRNQLEGSKLIKKRTNESYKFINETNVLENKMQSYYSIRCTPQILGPIYDAICYSEKVLNNEINSVNDNPIIDVESQNVFHGGNFHGDYVSYEMDKMKLGIIKLSILSERQLNYLF